MKCYSNRKYVKTVYGSGKKQCDKNIMKSIRNLFKLKKENEANKNKIVRDLRTLFKQEDDFYKPIRVGNFWNNNYIEYQTSDDRNKNLSVKE